MYAEGITGVSPLQKLTLPYNCTRDYSLHSLYCCWLYGVVFAKSARSSVGTSSMACNVAVQFCFLYFGASVEHFCCLGCF